VSATRTCTCCKQELPLRDFGPHPTSRGGRSSVCRPCVSVRTGAHNALARGALRFLKSAGTLDEFTAWFARESLDRAAKKAARGAASRPVSDNLPGPAAGVQRP
jgi:hypothetical protein